MNAYILQQGSQRRRGLLLRINEGDLNATNTYYNPGHIFGSNHNEQDTPHSKSSPTHHWRQLPCRTAPILEATPPQTYTHGTRNSIIDLHQQFIVRPQSQPEASLSIRALTGLSFPWACKEPSCCGGPTLGGYLSGWRNVVSQRHLTFQGASH